jgi:hypothetical protein
MAGTIDMVPDGMPMANSPESTIQSGGGGTIEMYGGDLGFAMGHTPVSSVQKGSASAGIDMAGEQGLLNKSIVTPYGSTEPADKGKV